MYVASNELYRSLKSFLKKKKKKINYSGTNLYFGSCRTQISAGNSD